MNDKELLEYNSSTLFFAKIHAIDYTILKRSFLWKQHLN